jgi:hypothetical protein
LAPFRSRHFVLFRKKGAAAASELERREASNWLCFTRTDCETASSPRTLTATRNEEIPQFAPYRKNKATFQIGSVSVRQEKTGGSSDLKGDHHVNYPFDM